MYEFDLPEGLSLADFRAHPVTVMLRESAARQGSGLPSKAELDGLGLPDGARRLVSLAATEVAGLFDEGLQDDARKLADENAAKVLGVLPEELRDPDYRNVRDETANLGPGELAGRIVTADPNYTARLS